MCLDTKDPELARPKLQPQPEVVIQTAPQLELVSNKQQPSLFPSQSNPSQPAQTPTSMALRR